MEDFTNARMNMVLGQIEPNLPGETCIINAIKAIPRQLFVPPHLRSIAYIDEHLNIGDSRYLLAPMVLAQFLQAVSIKPTDSVLDVGCATGYSSAVIAKLASKVIAIESENNFASKANFVLNSLGIRNSIVISTELAEGHPDSGPYDVIFLNGGIWGTPDLLLKQLADGGRLIAVIYDENATPGIIKTISGEATLFERDGNVISKRSLSRVSVYPLPDFYRRDSLFIH